MFGKRASELWSKKMQWAEGPEGFNDGYLDMQKLFEGDTARLQYIHELYKDENKTLFKKDLRFSNGVVVDVCESLIAATRSWVQGKGSNRKSVSLLLSVMRIVEGTRGLILRPFLKPPSGVTNRTVEVTYNFNMKELFRFFIFKLTSWAVLHMFKLVNRAGSYQQYVWTYY